MKVEAVVRVPFSPGLAEKIVEDRQWKMDNRRFIPLVAQYRKLMTKFLATPQNQTQIILKGPADE